MGPGAKHAPAGIRYRFGRFALDTATMVLEADGQAVPIEPKVREALLMLIDRAGEVVTHGEFFEQLWQARATSDHSLATVIRKLRSVLGDEAVATVHRYGYRFAWTVEVERVSRAQARLSLGAGESIGSRPNWIAETRLGGGGNAEVWCFRHQKTGDRRVFKFAVGAEALGDLKREVTVARLLAAGLADAAVFRKLIDWQFAEPPFFIELEYHERDLLQWAAESLAPTPLTTRLELVADLAEAVGAAHGLGLLHKDLKPSNVFVGEREGRLRAVIADFGSARLLDPETLDRLGITRLGFTQAEVPPASGSGTPIYMAPEVLAGQMPTAAADVYALGVVLYQMVVGDLRQPIPSDWQQGVVDALLREDIAAATASDPDRRLASATELARRLRALPARRAEASRAEALEAEALRARLALERTLERARARRPWIVAAVGALSLGIAVSLYYLQQARVQEARAQKQLQVADALNRFLRDGVVRAGDPFYGGVPAISLHDALASAATTIPPLFAATPALEAEIEGALAELFTALTDFPEAEKHWGRQVELLQASGAAASARLGAELGLAQVVTNRGRWDEARERLARVRADPAFTPRDRALQHRARFLQAYIDFESGRWIDADRESAALVADAGLSAAVSAIDRSRLLQLRANVLTALGRDAEALAVCEALIASTGRELGQEHVRYLYARMLRVSVINRMGRYEEAQREIQALLVDARQRLGPRHKDTLALEHELATNYVNHGQPERALPLLESIVQIRRQTLGPTHRQTLGAFSDLGAALLTAGRWHEALAANRDSYEQLSAALGAGHPETLVTGYNYVESLAREGQLVEARRQLARLRVDGAPVFPAAHQWTPRLRFLDGLIAERAGDPAQAREHWQQAYAGLKALLPAEDALMIELRRKLAIDP